MKTFLTWLISSAIILSASGTSFGQIRDVPFSVLKMHSSMVVEGVVKNSATVWNQHKNRIYTIFQIEVFDYLSGQGGRNIEIAQIGGCLDGHCQTLYPELLIGIGQKGIFFLKPFKENDLDRKDLLEVVSGPLGFVQFNEQSGNVFGVNGTRIVQNLDSEIYLPIAGKKMYRTQRKRFTIQLAAPNITSIFPDTLAAGVHDTLTILGTEFGFSKGKVWFQNADLPTGIFMHGENPELVVWTDTMIRVIVPSEGSLDSLNRGVAGTGPIRVESSDQLISQSIDSIFVPFGLKTRRVAFDSTAYTFILSSPYNTPLGGYQFRYDTGFASSFAAVAAFEKAVRDWRCASLVNFSIGPDTTIRRIATDSVSIVYWDTLDPGVLGQTLVDEEFCKDEATGIFYYHVVEVDMRFAQTVNYNFDTTALPAANQDDFYSIALHELGHGHLLMHVNRPGHLMHFELDMGTAVRSFNPQILDGAVRAIDSSIVNHNTNCFLPHLPIQPGDCNILNGRNSQTLPFGDLALYPNPAKSEINLSYTVSQSTGTLKAEVLDIYGRVLISKSFKSVPGTSELVKLDLSEIGNGYFLVRLGNASGTISKPLVIQH
jgi:hypothetical protein